MENVCITVLRANELEGNKLRKLSPYVEVRIDSQIRTTAVAKRQDTAPEWNEDLEFTDVQTRWPL